MSSLAIDFSNPQTVTSQGPVKSSSPDTPFEPILERASQKIRELAEKLVADSFVRPLLAQIQNDPFRTELFHGGFAEDVFADQLDTILADRMTHKANFPIVDTIHRTFMDALRHRPESLRQVATKPLNLIA